MMQTQHTVLIVDKDPGIQEVMITRFESQEFCPLTASTGAEALEIVHKTPPSAIVMAMDLGDMDGIQVLQELASEDITIPVIVLTGDGSAARAVAAMKLGAFDYVQKPFPGDRLVGLVAKAISMDADLWQEFRRVLSELRSNLL